MKFFSSSIINTYTWNLETPLHAAAKAGKSSTIELLLDYGADVDLKENKGKKYLCSWL